MLCQVTHYSADRVVVTQTQSQTPAPVAAAEEGGVGGVGAGQISQIIQNVLLNLIGGGLLGNTHQHQYWTHCNHCCCPGGGAGGGGGGAQETLTSLITHTRTLLTTATNTDTVLIPVNYRGTEIFQVSRRVSGPRVTCHVSQTVTEHNLVTSTTTDYSVQTLLSFVPATKPFYPLAPTLHR